MGYPCRRAASSICCRTRGSTIRQATVRRELGRGGGFVPPHLTSETSSTWNGALVWCHYQYLMVMLLSHVIAHE